MPLLNQDQGDLQQPVRPLGAAERISASGSIHMYSRDTSWDALLVGGTLVSPITKTIITLRADINDGQGARHEVCSILRSVFDKLETLNSHIPLAKLQQNVQLVLTGGWWHSHPDQRPVEWRTFLTALTGNYHRIGDPSPLFTVRDTSNDDIEVSINRRLFMTAEGQLGLGHRNIEHGDMVWILFGCKHLVILRPQGDEWDLISLVYMLGISGVRLACSPLEANLP